MDTVLRRYSAPRRNDLSVQRLRRATAWLQMRPSVERIRKLSKPPPRRQSVIAAIVSGPDANIGSCLAELIRRAERAHLAAWTLK